jgi:hypothetical protein
LTRISARSATGGESAGRRSLAPVIEFAAKLAGYDLALTDAGDGRVLVQLLDEHGIAAGEKLV